MIVKFENKTHLRDEEIVKFIKTDINIENVIDKLGGLNLLKTGNSLQGNCPTGHPSQGERCFSVNTEKNYYNCFHCGAAGDNINLVQLVTNTSFVESLNWFKDNFDLELDITDKVNEVEEAHKVEGNSFYIKQSLLEEIVRLGHIALFGESAEAALTYLTGQRGYTVENLKQTDWFYLPKTNRVKKVLLEKYPNYSKQIDEISLSGYFGDNFRLAFPYRDRYGKITGFLKRAPNPSGLDIKTLDGKEHQAIRWDSSKGTKKKDLFGIHKCKEEETIVVVEGYPDSLYLPTLGLNNIVAVGQGILSKTHLEAVKEFNIKNVVISFDNDPPKADGELTGVENTIKAVDLLTQKSDVNVFVLDPQKLGEHKDPDEFVKAYGIERLRQLLDNAEFGLSWRAKNILSGYDLNASQQWQQALESILDYDLIVTDQLKSDQFLTVAAGILGVELSVLKEKAISYKQKLERKAVAEEYFSVLDRAKKHIIEDKIEDSVELMEKDLTDLKVKLFKSSIKEETDLGTYLEEKYNREKNRTAEFLGYRLNKFEDVCRNVDGIQPGFYFIGAETNIGKTAFATNLFVDLLDSNKNVKGLYLSLDDNKDVIINRFVSIKSEVMLNAIQRKRIESNDEARVKNAYNDLIDFSEAGRLNIYDISQVTHINDIEGLIATIGNENLVIVIDGLYNLSVNAEAQNIRVENIERANKIKTLVDTYRLPIICTGELRKKTADESAKKLPSNHDLMESGKFGYNTNVIWLLSNSKEQEGMSDNELKLMLNYSKNKLSHFKGFQQLKFKKSTGTVEEIKEEKSLWA